MTKKKLLQMRAVAQREQKRMVHEKMPWMRIAPHLALMLINDALFHHDDRVLGLDEQFSMHNMPTRLEKDAKEIAEVTP